jgi:hypothetical protein
MSRRLPEEEKVYLHIIRQDYARALCAYEANPNIKTTAEWAEVFERRARAVRQLAEDFSVKEIAALLRMSKTAVREAIANGGE